MTLHRIDVSLLKQAGLAFLFTVFLFIYGSAPGYAEPATASPSGPPIDLEPVEVHIDCILVEYRTLDVATNNLSSLRSDTVRADALELTDLKDINDSRFQASLSALVKSGDAIIRARPSVATVAGREAVLSVQARENFQSAQSSSTDDVPLLQIQRISTGPTIRITPMVSMDIPRAIKIDASFEISSVVGRSASGLPLIRTRSARNTMFLKNEHTAVIVELGRDNARNDHGDFPSSPVSGSSYSNRPSPVRASTLVLYVTPRVIEPDASHTQVISRSESIRSEDSLEN